MRHMITIILMLALPGVACAAGSFEQSDFIPRLVNFILFVAINVFSAIAEKSEINADCIIIAMQLYVFCN